MNKSSPSNWGRFQGRSKSMMASGYVSPYKDVEAKSCDKDFIPLNSSTPDYRLNEGNRFASPFNRNHYYAKAKAHCNNSVNPYKHVAMRAHRQQKNYHRGARRHVNISDYIDIKSILEDPWAELEKKLEQSRINDQMSTSNSGSFISDSKENKTNSQNSRDNQLIETENSSFCTDNSSSEETEQCSPKDVHKSEQNVTTSI